MHQIQIQYHQLPFTEVIIGSFEEKLCLVDYVHRKKRDAIDRRMTHQLKATYVEKTSDVIETCKQQLDEYFKMERTTFDIPLSLVGSSFQQQVWKALLKVPYGETASYLDLAKAIGNEKAVRAVANANGANGISIIVPCHRIIGSDGSLTGYAGGLPLKKKLLELENNLFSAKH